MCVQYRVGDRHRVYNSAVAGKSPPITPWLTAMQPLCRRFRRVFVSSLIIVIIIIYGGLATTTTSPRVYYRYYYYKHIVVLNSRRQVRAADARLLVYSHNILHYAYDEILIIIILHCAFRYNFATGLSSPGCVIY